jgi:hypothetical protein
MSNLRQGLVGEYLFNGNAEDTSGFGRHGRIEGATLTDNRYGEANSAYAFSGQGNYIELNPIPNLGAEAFSLSVWAKYDQEAALKGWNNAIVSQDDHGRMLDQSRRVFQLSTKGEYVTWHRMRQSTDVVGKQPIQLGVWYHFVAIYDGAQHRLYVNGELQNVQTGSFGPNVEEPIYIGKKNTDEKRFWFHGVLDDIRIYDRALSDNEVLELYAEHGYAGDPGWMPTPPRTVRKAAAAKKWINKPIRVRKTLEFRNIEWNDCYNSFALALYGIMRYSHKQISWPLIRIQPWRQWMYSGTEACFKPRCATWALIWKCLQRIFMVGTGRKTPSKERYIWCGRVFSGDFQSSGGTLTTMSTDLFMDMMTSAEY